MTMNIIEKNNMQSWDLKYKISLKNFDYVINQIINNKIKKVEFFYKNEFVFIKFFPLLSKNDILKIIESFNNFIFEKKKEVLKDETNKQIRSLEGVLISKTEWLQKSQNYQDIINRFTSQLVVKSQGGKITEKEITQEEYQKAISLIEKKDKIIYNYHNVLKPALQQAKEKNQLDSFNPKITTVTNKKPIKQTKGLFNNIFNKLFTKN